MLNNFAATQGGRTDTVTTTTILDGTIANDDIASDAAIALSKLDGVTSNATELNLLDGRTIVGDCYGPGSATDNGIARFDGVAGKTIQNSGVTIADNGDMTLGGGMACADGVVSRPRFTDYSETVNGMGSKTAAFDIDLEDGNVQTLTMSGGGTFNIGIVNAVGSHSNSVTILGTNLGSCTATFLAGANGSGGNAVYWAGGGDTSNNLMTSSGTDVVTLTTFDGGTNWYGMIAGKAFANS